MVLGIRVRMRVLPFGNGNSTSFVELEILICKKTIFHNLFVNECGNNYMDGVTKKLHIFQVWNNTNSFIEKYLAFCTYR